MDLTTEEAWRLLTNNLPAETQQQLRVSGDDIVAVLRRTRAIIATPK